MSRSQRWQRPMVRLACLWVIAMAVCGSAMPAKGQEALRPRVTGLEVGFDGHYKVGVWTPVDVTLSGGDEPLIGRVQIIVADGDGALSAVNSRPLQLLPGGSHRQRLLVKFGRAEGTMTVRLIDENGKIVLDRQFDAYADDDGLMLPMAMGAEEVLYLTLGASLGIEEATAYLPRNNGNYAINNEPQIARLSDASQLPTAWEGYQAIDALLIAGSRVEPLEPLRRDSAQLSALDQWIKMGGKLVLSVGAEAPTLFNRGPLALFAPGELGPMETLRQTTALENFGGAGVPVPIARGTFTAQVATFTSPTGVIESSQGDVPLVIRSPHGFGAIVLTTVALDRRPLADWTGRGAFVHRLLHGANASIARDDQEVAAVPTYLGVESLTGQLRSALDFFPDVKIISFGWVLALVLFYILLIGPGDYFLVKRVLRRMELTWITFPILVLTFSVAAYFFASWLKGDRLLVNQVDVVDYDVATGFTRGYAWSNVFTPKTAAYDLSLQADGVPVEHPDVLFSWLGLPGNALGGMEAPRAGPRLFARSYRYSDTLDALAGVPIPVWSTKAFEAIWHDDNAAAPWLEAELTAGVDQIAEGAVTNHTDVTLRDALLVYGTWVHPLEDLAPGETKQIFAESQQLDLQTVLKRVTLQQEDKNTNFRRQTEQWDPASREIPEILRMMMLHDAAGGMQYTGLSNNYHHELDFSDRLPLLQAVLIAQVDAPATQLLNHGQPLPGKTTNWTVYRFVIPVTQTTPGG